MFRRDDGGETTPFRGVISAVGAAEYAYGGRGAAYGDGMVLGTTLEAERLA